MKKQKAADKQPHISPDSSKESRVNVPNDKEQQIGWQNRQGNLHKEAIQRGKNADRLKGGENRD
jgi:hypothetical protein